MFLELILIFVVALVMIKVIIVNALKFGLVDVPNARSMHVRHHPRGAGIGFFMAVALVEPFFHFDLLTSHTLSLLAILAVFIVGLLDDHQDTAPNTKFIVIGLASLMVYFDGISVTTLGNLFGFDMSLGWLALPFTLFAIVGFTNALNLIDGLDGLAGSVSVVILGALFSIGYVYEDTFMLVISSAFIAGLLAFLIYNWNPASIFMGDSGSLTLGFIIGVLVIKAAAYVHPVTVLFLIAIPLMDTIIVMVRRKRNGKSMFAADKTHLHHVLFIFFNRNVKKTVLFLAMMQAIYSITALQIVESADQTMSLILFALNVLAMYFVFSEMLRRQANKECQETADAEEDLENIIANQQVCAD
jgi:UDP-GlcNAc:undecaprenyl-phosphate GlcNAc-1-phosphate transferase